MSDLNEWPMSKTDSLFSNHAMGAGPLQTPNDERFHRLITNIPQQVWTASPDGSLDYVNPQVTDYFGRSFEDMLGAGWIESVHPDDLHETIVRWAKSLATGCNYETDFRLRRADGCYRWHIARASALLDDQGNITQWVGTSTDITSRKETEAALALSEAHLAAAQAHALIGSWELDLVKGNSAASSEWFEIMELDPAQGVPSFDEFVARVHPADVPGLMEHHIRGLNDKSGSQLDFRIVLQDGSTRWIEARSVTVFDENEKPLRMVGTSQNITERKHAELALNASESRFRAFMEKTPALAFIKDEPGHFVYINPTFERVFQLTQDEILGTTVFDHWPVDIAQKLHDHDLSIFASNQQTEAFEDVPSASGMRHWLTVKFVFSNAHGQRFLGCTAVDLTDRHQAEQALRTSTELLNVSQYVAQIGGWQLDVATQKLFWTDQIYHLLDATADEVQQTIESGLEYCLPESRPILLRALNDAIKLGEGFDLELEMRTRKGRKIDVRVICTVTLENGKPTKLNGVFQDISEQKAAQLALEYANQELAYANRVLENIAHYDALTHLPNRVLLADRMQQAMARTKRSDQSLAVAFLDLDGFKAINDKHGHAVGDQLLIHFAQRMKSTLREGDTMARIGGDEFVVVLTDLQHTSDCEPLLRRLLEAAAEPVMLDDLALEVSASIGVTIYPQDGSDAEQLMRHADQAMYLAKQAGKNCYHMFDIAKDVAVKHQRETLEHIRAALHNSEFVLYYQPKVHMRTGQVIGVEALIRWQHPQYGLCPPASFLPVIENHLLSVELGEWVIETALNQMIEWECMGLELPVSVNIGAMQLQQSNFAERLEALLILHPAANPHNLELEILETSALEDITQVSAIINNCKALGVSFALDDFGTGYSSLAYLKRLPAGLLKIDQSFVRDMLDDADDLAIIKGIVGLANAFHRRVIAEGVETIAHGEILLAMGCELAQGYGIARPMPAAAIPEWVSTWRPDSAWVK
jgi:diguanylate cyclase (GGDEF)-like protein/PAS domain S-box-containing protein